MNFVESMTRGLGRRATRRSWPTGLLTWVMLAASIHGCGSSSAEPKEAGSSATETGASEGGGTNAKDAGMAPTYPPLKFSDIGTATLISNTFYFTEGPVWDPKKNVLYFTDINAPAVVPDGGQDGGQDDGGGGAGGGAIYRLTLPSTIDVFFQPDGNADGLGLDPQGNIIAAGFASRSAWRLTTSNAMQVFSPCAQGGGTCYMGQEINTPDDITSRSDGVIYFTDPTFANGGQGFPMETLPLMGAQGVYRMTTDGVLHLEDMTTSGPNGVNLSPDEKSLYVAYTLASEVAKFDVAADGSLSNKTTFATGTSIADSMCVDAGGNVYVGTLSGLAVFDPTGKALGTISVGGLITTNCAFGGPDQKTLFITSRTQATLSGVPPMGGGALYQIANMPVPGIPGQN
jgi:gluconolactonase